MPYKGRVITPAAPAAPRPFASRPARFAHEIWPGATGADGASLVQRLFEALVPMPTLHPNDHPSTTNPTGDRFAAASASCGDDLLELSAHAPVRLMFGPVVRLASAARRTGTSPERLVTTLKSLLQQTPRLASFEPDEREHAMDDLVSLSIEVFFDLEEDDPQTRRDDAA